MHIRVVGKSKTRHGSILVVVLVTLLVATMLGAALIKTVLIHHRQMRVLGGQQQSFWLAEAGLQRAARELASKPEYEGEIWEVSPDVLGASRSASVTIEVTPGDKPNEREIHVNVLLDDQRIQPTGFQREQRYVISPQP